MRVPHMNVKFLIERLDNTVRTLPKKPGKSYKMPKQDAIKHPWLQVNRNGFVEWLVIDIDEPGAAHFWEDVEAPAPNFVVINPENQHAQYYYHLEVPVYSWYKQRRTKAYRYLKAVYDGLVRLLKGDKSCGLHGLRKNPIHKKWLRHDLHQASYSLGELAEYVELFSGIGSLNEEIDDELRRNCSLFNAGRRWAYKHINVARTSNYNYWYLEVLNTVRVFNKFNIPLPESEVRSIAKSIAVYVKYKYSGCQRAFRDREKHSDGMTTHQKQVLAAKETNRIRTSNTLQKIKSVIQKLKDLGHKITIAAISKKTGLHRNTIAGYKAVLFN